MIVSVPVFYAATVVPQGKRNEIMALLAATAHVRVPVPSGLGVAVRISRDFLDDISSHGLRRDGREAVPTEIEEVFYSESETSETLLAPFRFRSPRGPYGRTSEAITGRAMEALGARMLERGQQLGLIVNGPNTWPFQSPDTLGHADENTPLFAEDTPFRSMTPMSPDARNIALAHAARAGAQLRGDASGLLLVPSPGPSLAVSGGQGLLEAPRQPWRGGSHSGLKARFRVDQVEEAVALASLTREYEGGTLIEDFSAEVMRPAAYDWSPLLEVAASTTTAVSSVVSVATPSRADLWPVERAHNLRTAAIAKVATGVVMGDDSEGYRTLLNASLDTLRCQRDLLGVAMAENGPRTIKGRNIAWAMGLVVHALAMAERTPEPRWHRPPPGFWDPPGPARRSTRGGLMDEIAAAGPLPPVPRA